jgi:transposase
MENASTAFLGAIRQTMRVIAEEFRSGTLDPETLTCAEQRQYENWRRREAINQDISALAKAGLSIKAIVRKTGHARAIVRQILRRGRTDVCRPRVTSLDPFQTHLETEWAQDVAITARSCGADFEPPAIRVHHASSLNGQHDSGRMRLRLRPSAHPRLVLSRVC